MKDKTDWSQFPGSWDELVKWKGLNRRNRLKLKMLGRMPMAKPMLDNVMLTMKAGITEFEAEHGRPPTQAELGPVMEQSIRNMSAGLVKPRKK